MGAFRPTTFSKKELAGLSPAQAQEAEEGDRAITWNRIRESARSSARKATPMLKKLKKA